MAKRLCLLGPPRLTTETGTRDLPLDRPASLGYYLALRGDWVRRAELADLYNPDADEPAAFSNLRKLAHRLRHQGWADGLESDGSRLRLRLPTDVQEFRGALARRNWAEALACHGGTLLDGLTFPDLAGVEAWLEVERQELSRAWRAALFEHVRALEAQSDWAEAETWLARLLRVDPIDEQAVQAMLRVLQASGQSAHAEAIYERFRRDLVADIGVEPLEATRALAASLQGPRHEAVSADRPPLRQNLPAAGSRFVGRARELDALSAHLAKPDCRLLTIVGLGGMGKTRLALALATQQLALYDDGVWWAPLAEVTRTELVVPSLAAAVGLVFSGPSDPKRQLLNFLRGKHMLLLLDNVEHLKAAGVLLEELLAEAPRLKLLLTSRVALETASEWLFDLDGLPCPPASGDPPLQQFDAVSLFVSRAERFSNRFTLTETTLREVAELTRRVEGMPLALELAATWVRGLSVGEIVARLQQGVDLLHTEGSSVPERQRHLQTVLAHSWQLLSDTEQSILARLAVLRGSFSAEAAQQVAGAHLALLLRLINQALLRSVEGGRYELHELVRQFAERQLPAADRPEVQERFADHFEALLQRLGQEVRGGMTPDTVARCRRELGHIVSALEHLAATGQTARLVAALASFYTVIEITGLAKVGIAQVEALRALLPGSSRNDPRLCGALDAVSAYFHVKVGDDDRALQLAHSAVMHLQDLPPSDDLGIALGAAGICSHFAGRFEEATDWYRQALAVFEARDNRSEQCRVLNRLAAAMYQLDRIDESNVLYQRALEIATAAGDLSEQANLLNNYGINFESTGRVDEALRMYRGSLEIGERIQFLRVQAAAWTNLGHVHERRAEYVEARRHYERSLEIKRELGEPVALAVSLTNLADVLYALGDDALGHRSNLEAMAHTLSAHAHLYAARAVWSFCKYFLKSGQTEHALRLACFLTKTPEREQWVSDEAAALIAAHSGAVDAAVWQHLRSQAEAMDHAAVADWLGHHRELQPPPPAGS